MLSQWGMRANAYPTCFEGLVVDPLLEGLHIWGRRCISLCADQIIKVGWGGKRASHNMRAGRAVGVLLPRPCLLPCSCAQPIAGVGGMHDFLTGTHCRKYSIDMQASEGRGGWGEADVDLEGEESQLAIIQYPAQERATRPEMNAVDVGSDQYTTLARMFWAKI